MSTEKIIYKGVPYRRYPNSEKWSDRNYFACSYETAKRKGIDQYLHRQIWREHHGEIPEGYHIHHLDDNPLNNDIENLECIPNGEHQKLHAQLWSEERLTKAREHMLSKVIPAAAKRIIPESELQQRSENSKRMWADASPKQQICEYCGKEFEAPPFGVAKYCSGNCKTADRRKSGVDNETRICAICGNQFTVDKYAKTQTCSRRCAWKLREK